jgi:hypothetical protein
MPLTQCFPLGHGMPQPPQFLSSLDVLTQSLVVGQYVGVLPLHETPHAFPSQLADPEPAVGPGHAEHEVAPHELTSWLLTHEPLQTCVPSGHLQLPPLHCRPPVHAKEAPHPPQLLLSFCSSTHAPAHDV